MPDYLSFGLEKARTLAASANPIAPEEEIDAVVEQVPEVQSSEKPYRVGQLLRVRQAPTRTLSVHVRKIEPYGRALLP
jgi:hypothetical protein